MSGHSARATLALQRLAEEDPALGALALWCAHRDADGDGPPASTDGRTIFYGAGFARLPSHEQTGLAAHQILHVAFRHAARARAMFARMGDRFDEEVFALGTDAIVNEALVLAGHALPRPCLELTPLLAETLGERTAPGEALARWDTEALYVRLMQARRDGKGEGESPAERAKAAAARAGFEADLDWRAADPEAETEDEAAAEWRERIARAMAAGRAAGRGIGAAGHRIADLPRPGTPWEAVLRGLLAKALTPRARQGWRRPARSWLALDAEAARTGGPRPAIQPALLRESHVPRIALGIDCSGSIDDGRLALFAAQIAGIARRLAAEIHVLGFDTGIRLSEKLAPGACEAAMGRLSFARGGGTDFGPALAAAAALDPSVIVMLTDLDGPMGAAPRAPVIWAVPGEPGRRPPFGRLLSLSR